MTYGFSRVPVRESRDQHSFDSSPELFAVFHALQSLLTPRHPPCALSSLTTLIERSRFPPNLSRSPEGRSPRSALSIYRISAIIAGKRADTMAEGNVLFDLYAAFLPVPTCRSRPQEPRSHGKAGNECVLRALENKDDDRLRGTPPSFNSRCQLPQTELSKIEPAKVLAPRDDCHRRQPQYLSPTVLMDRGQPRLTRTGKMPADWRTSPPATRTQHLLDPTTSWTQHRRVSLTPPEHTAEGKNIPEPPIVVKRRRKIFHRFDSSSEISAATGRQNRGRIPARKNSARWATQSPIVETRRRETRGIFFRIEPPVETRPNRSRKSRNRRPSRRPPRWAAARPAAAQAA